MAEGGRSSHCDTLKEIVTMPIPQNAKRVFHGEIFDVYQWQQTLFDGSVATFERLKRLDTVQVITVVGDTILVQQQEQPDMPSFFSLPGGRLDAGEEPLAAAKRELAEETGYVSDDWELWKTFQPQAKIDWNVYTYIARNCTQKQAQKLDAGERIVNTRVSFDAFLRIADNNAFRGDNLACELLRMQLHPEQQAEFRRRLFGVP